MTLRTDRKQAGQIIIMTAIGLITLIGAVGLAIDSGLGYLTKAKLNAAVDSAGVAAARAVSQGADPAAQIANAKQAAREFFAANYPGGYLGTTPTFNDPTFAFDRGKITIGTSAQAVLPVTFMQVMGFKFLNVGARAETVRKDLDLAFVMDTSGSMSGVASEVRAAGQSFIDRFNPLADRLALIHFAAGAVVDDPIQPVQRGFDQASLKKHIGKFGFSGYTNHAEGMWHGRDQLNSISMANRSSLRVIVFFSDGSPNTFASNFEFKAHSGCPSPSNGAIATGDGSATGEPQGLYRYDWQDKKAPGNCDKGSNIAAAITALPQYYNAHNSADTEFSVVTDSPRTVTSQTTPDDTAWRNINLAARNLPEAMADKAKSEGIYVFTLGLGDLLKQPLGVPDSSGTRTGEDLLKCMANTGNVPPDSLPARCHDATKPQGIYCYAATENDLKPCFAQLASEILRITR